MIPFYDPYNPYGFGLDNMQDTPEEDMTPEEHDALRLHAAVCGCATFLLVFIVGLLLCLLLGSCTTTKVVTVEKVRTDTTYITQQQRDSIWLHDSVHVIEKQIGDTVYLLHDRWHTKYVESIKHDTLYQSRVDSVGVPYPVEVYIDKPLNKWRQMRLLFGDIFIIIIGVLGIIAIIKLKTKIWP